MHVDSHGFEGWQGKRFYPNLKCDAHFEEAHTSTPVAEEVTKAIGERCAA